MHDDLRAGGLLDASVAADVVRVAVGVDDVLHLQLFFTAVVEDAILVAARVDDRGLAGGLAGDDVAADAHHAHGELFD